MPLPAGWTLITVTGTYTRVDGGPASGQIDFCSAQVVVIDGVTVVPGRITVSLDDNGAFSTQLPSTTDPDLDVTGWAYTVYERIQGGRDPYSIFVEYDGGPIDLATVSPVVTPPLQSGYATAAQMVAMDARVDALEAAPGGGTWGTITGTLSSQTDLQAALDGKVATTVTVNGHALSGNVTVSKADVGLGNADNTPDANKPISTATQTALDAKADLVAGVIPSAQIPAIAITEYLGSVASQAAMLALSGQKGDWALRSDLGTTWIITGTDPTQLADWTQLNYPTAPVTSVNGQTGTVTLAKGDVGLGNVDNTSDANKPVSTAQQTALDTKQAALSLAANQFYARDSAGAAGNKTISDDALTFNAAANFAAMRSALGATTVGANLFTLANPGAVTFPRINADNTITARTAAELASDIGAPSLSGTNTWTAQNIFAIGTITTSQPHTITQTWNAAGVTFTGKLNNFTSTASAAGSILEEWQLGGTRKFAIDKNGSWYSTANALVDVSAGSTWDYKIFGTSMFVVANGTVTVPSGANLKLALGVAYTSAIPTIASAGTIAPAARATFISGTATVSTITPPGNFTSGGELKLIPTGAWTWDTAGNIAVAGTAVVSRQVTFTYSAATAKWYPSYV